MLFDPEANILCIEIAKGKISHTREFGNFIIHVSAAGKPVLIEVLEASKFINQVETIKNIKDIKQIKQALPT